MVDASSGMSVRGRFFCTTSPESTCTRGQGRNISSIMEICWDVCKLRACGGECGIPRAATGYSRCERLRNSGPLFGEVHKLASEGFFPIANPRWCPPAPHSLPRPSTPPLSAPEPLLSPTLDSRPRGALSAPRAQALIFPQDQFQHILRILNTNVDGRHKVPFAITSIKGVGRRFANMVCKKAEVNLQKR